MSFDIEKLVRENIKQMAAYSSARHEFSSPASVFLDANENAFGSPISSSILGKNINDYNRYPDPLQWDVKQKLSTIKGVPPQNIFLGNGSDEAIDLLFRIFCVPGRDNAIIFPPTYGMYEVCAATNDIELKKISLKDNFQLNLELLESTIDDNSKLIFICSPNNPTGNSINRADIELILNNFDGLVVIDEAYINFSKQKTFVTELTEYPNLVILQTLSKAWGLAGLRVGMAFAGSPIIDYMNKVKYPYNINQASQELTLNALENISQVNDWIQQVVAQRDWLLQALKKLSFVQNIYPSDANFILVQMNGANEIFNYLTAKGIVVRNRSKVELCNNCLRITIGTINENEILLNELKNYKSA